MAATTRVTVATANVQCSLSRTTAAGCLDAVLDERPDLVGLQEWSLARWPVLARHGRVGLLGWPGHRQPLLPRCGRPGRYTWLSPVVGGCAVGARADRYDLVGAGLRLLSRPGLVAGVPLPGRVASVSLWRDRWRPDAPATTLVDLHLTPGVQAAGRYRTDRPGRVARHRAEVARLQQVVDAELARGHVVHAVGDGNFAGLRLVGLTSAWQGREGHPGSLGDRLVDDVHGPGRADVVRLVQTASDHRAVLVTRSA